jgi:SAM-dependent methyltransferase
MTELFREPISLSGDAPYTWGVDDPRGYSNRMGRYKTEREWRFIRSHLPGRQLAILDLAGGSGRFAERLSSDGHSVTVVDISRPALAALAQRRLPRVEIVEHDILTLPVERLFDVVIMIEGLVYLTSVPATEAFARIARHLRPGAPFILTSLNRSSWRSIPRTLLRRGMPYRTQCASEVRAALDEGGFSLIAMEGFMWQPFAVRSNSPLVGFFGGLERGLGLGRWLGQSPWHLVAARKR